MDYARHCLLDLLGPAGDPDNLIGHVEDDRAHAEAERLRQRAKATRIDLLNPFSPYQEQLIHELANFDRPLRDARRPARPQVRRQARHPLRRDMIPVTVNEIQKGDLIRFTEKSAAYTVTRTQIHSFEHPLRLLSFGSSGPGDVTMPANATVYAEKMIREVQVPCRARRHGDDLITILWNKADGPPPRVVICGACDAQVVAEVAAEVMAKKPRPEPKVGDRVFMPGGELAITGFDEDNGTQLSDGRWVCASRFEYLGPNAWWLTPEKEAGA